MLLALALGLSYLEHLVPLPLPVGVKLGLANLVTLVSFCLLGWRPTLLLVCLRCVVVSLLFGTPTGLVFSLVGGLLSFVGMAWAFRGYEKSMTLYGISVIGAALHHIGQIVTAVFWLQSVETIWYLPTLLLLSVPTGLLTGGLAGMMVARLKKGTM